MGNPIKFIGCLVKGHEINPKESIMLDVMINPYNLLCPCHRCGFYMMYDSMSGMGVTITKKQAFKIKQEFIDEYGRFVKIPEDIYEAREQIYGRGDTDGNI